MSDSLEMLLKSALSQVEQNKKRKYTKRTDHVVDRTLNQYSIKLGKAISSISKGRKVASTASELIEQVPEEFRGALKDKMIFLQSVADLERSHNPSANLKELQSAEEVMEQPKIEKIIQKDLSAKKRLATELSDDEEDLPPQRMKEEEPLSTQSTPRPGYVMPIGVSFKRT